MKHFQIFCLLFVLAMSAACSTTPSGTAQSDIKDTPTSPEVTAEVPPENKPVPENQDPDNTYHNGEVGFSITKPSNWLFMNPEIVQAHMDKVQLSDKNLEALVKKKKAPLVVITRYPMPAPSFNPNVVVKLAAMPAEGFPLKDVMSLALKIIKQSFPNLTYVEEIQDAKVDGIEGAYSKSKYTMSSKGREYRVMVRMWLISRGKIMFSIVMTGPQEGPDVSEEAFKEIVKSIRIER